MNKRIHTWLLCSAWVLLSVTLRAQNTVQGYEYWFDGDIAGRSFVELPEGEMVEVAIEISTSQLPAGIHTVHLRTRDAGGRYSSVQSKTFTHLPEAADTPEKRIISYSYWFDDDIVNAQEIPIEESPEVSLNIGLNAVGLSGGMHRVYFRTRDNSGAYSSALTRSFVHSPESANVPERKISAYRIWLDDEIAAASTVSVDEVNEWIASIAWEPEGLASRILHFQTRDNTGMWSSAQAHIVFITPLTTEIAERKLIAWQYWFNDDFENAVTVDDFAPEGALNISEALDMSQFPQGEYAINLRFLDNTGLWSSSCTSGFTKIPNPIADFIVSGNEACTGEMLLFANTSIDADEFYWEFGDGGTSTLAEPSFVYVEEGIYEVILWATNSGTGESASSSQTVSVGAIPDVSISASSAIPACPGNVQLTALPEGFAYSWSTGETSQEITANEAGSYTCTLTSTINPACSSESAPFELSFLSINTEILQEGNTLFASLNNAEAYQWLDCNQSFLPIEGAIFSSYEPGQNGSFAVEIESQGCTVQSECVDVTSIAVSEVTAAAGIMVFPNPVEDRLHLWFSDDPGRTEFRIISISGQLVYSAQAEGGSQQVVSLPSLSPGIYFLEFLYRGEMQRVRLVKG